MCLSEEAQILQEILSHALGLSFKAQRCGVRRNAASARTLVGVHRSHGEAR